jgi:hypothetical protein
MVWVSSAAIQECWLPPYVLTVGCLREGATNRPHLTYMLKRLRAPYGVIRGVNCGNGRKR